MTPEEYINFKKEDFKCDCIEVMVAHDEGAAEDCFNLICTYIERLKAVRSSDKLTEKIVNELIKTADYSEWYETSKKAKSKFIICWLIIAMEVNPTYYKAELLLNEYQNKSPVRRRTGQEINRISDIELFELLQEEENNSDRASSSTPTIIEVDHSALLKSLSKFISGINNVEFNFFMKHHSLLPGTPKAMWEGKKADAHRFATYIDISLPDFNKCFLFSNGGKLRHNDKDIQGKGSQITDILKAYFNK